MQISRLESFALEKLLQPQSNHALVTAQPALRVLERVQTTAGIYSIIQLPASLQALQNSTELEWPFKLKRLKAKGYFVCWAESETTLCLEAVISKGVCPPDLSLEQFA
ncbi:hypothetical protein [uncultured Pseudomonas sp.]|uniref:hypothetical protein n=1 Tax=uncultured Pseudomonas sp. TaxID=114707 RepID=UPI0030DB4E52|tara:strand:+ start:13726 stop:14049 length:324 start_codon:yes stop_codon:yes gene_type:complete